MRAPRLLALMVLPLLLWACSEEKPQRAMTTATRAAKPPPAMPEEATADPLAEAEPEYVYSPIGKRDPFRSPFSDLRPFVDGATADERKLTPLQKWDLDQLYLRGTVTATSSPMAMVVDPEGRGHVLTRGTLIGKNWGKVTAIKRDCVVVTEQLRDATQAVVAVKQERCLPRTDDEIKMERQFEQ